MTREFGAGDVIASKYRLSRMLGEGGMGQVWRAYNTALDIDVAVKLIRRELTDPAIAERLLQEARAAAKLGHPGIVRMMDCGVAEGDPFIVMEFLEGESLGALLLRKGTLSPERAVRTLLPVMSALSVAHEKGIVHRDLKPDNVMICREASGVSQPKLVDFGIAKLRNRTGPGLTEQGALVGSPAYMSPEQARGEAGVDVPTDIWAMSVLLFEAITGQLPFEGATQAVLLVAIMIREPKAPSEFGADDQGLWPLIARGLKKDASGRWASMREFGAALAGWALARGIKDDITGGSIEALWLGNHVISDVELGSATLAAQGAAGRRVADIETMPASFPPPPAGAPGAPAPSAYPPPASRLPAPPTRAGASAPPISFAATQLSAAALGAPRSDAPPPAVGAPPLAPLAPTPRAGVSAGTLSIVVLVLLTVGALGALLAKLL
jgi:eukaryotic-like serine/threonine-protein kinase